jgi:NADH-quinone oxidoreductase subunit M
MMTPASVAGAVFMMVAHGITSAAMFFVVGVVYDRLHHRDLTRMGGLADAMPVYTRFAAIFIFASLGLPGLCGFVGEILVLMGTFAAISHGPVAGTTAPWTIYLFGSLAAFGIVLSAGYMLWTLQRVYLGKRSESEPVLAEVTTRESIVLWPLAVLAVALGVLPWPLVLIFSQGTIEALLKVFS